MSLDILKASPGPARALGQLNTAAGEHAIEVGLPPALVEVVQIRASQVNGCAFCLRVHVRKAVDAGVDHETIALVATWREAVGYFDEPTRAALELAEAITHVSDGQVPPEVVEHAREVLDDVQVSAVAWIAIAINASNRAVVAGHPHVAP